MPPQERTCEPEVKQEIPKFGKKRWFMYLTALTFGIHYRDLAETEHLVYDESAWSHAMAEIAAHYDQLAQEASEAQHLQSALQWWCHAADYYHYAQITYQGDRKGEYQRRSRQAFRRIASHFVPSCQRIEIPFQNTLLPGYLRIFKPGAPCVILINSYNTAKEVEVHKLTDIFLQRGLSVAYFDGPGQGEVGETLAMISNYEIAVSAVIDFLTRQASVGEAAPIGIFGFSFAAYLAIRATAMDRRIRACISLGGFFDGSVFRRLSPGNQAGLTRQFKARDIEAIAVPESQNTLAVLPQAITQPFFIIHGGSDHLVSMEQIERLRGWAQGETRVWIIENTEHACFSRFNQVLPMMGDWMAEQLQRKN
jgi:2,6-dihydroxypseudooxynicotine hydrolase